MAITDFFENLVDLKKVDWEIMKERYWANTPEDGDRKRRRQAEFLIHQCCPWTLITTIGVKDSTTGKQVLELISGTKHRPEVSVMEDWYYS